MKIPPYFWEVYEVWELWHGYKLKKLICWPGIKFKKYLPKNLWKCLNFPLFYLKIVFHKVLLEPSLILFAEKTAKKKKKKKKMETLLPRTINRILDFHLSKIQGFYRLAFPKMIYVITFILAYIYEGLKWIASIIIS